MRFIFLILLMSVTFSAWAAQESKQSNTQEDKKAEEILSSKDISTQMANVWCQKMKECAKKGEMSVQECKKVLFKSFKLGFDNLPAGQEIQLTQSSLSQCVDNIKQGTCDSLKTARSIPGCEFISQLNQGN